MSNFGRWLKAELKNKDMKQTALAREVGVTQSAVSRWLDGAIITPENVRAVARALRKNVNDVLVLAGYGPVPYDPENPIVIRDSPIVYSDVQSAHQHDAIRTAQHVPGGADPSGGVTLAEEVDTDLFSVVVVGECLYPQVEPDDMLLLSRSKVPQVGDIVSVIVNGERHIKLVMQRNGGLVLASQRGELRLPSEGAVLEGVVIRQTRDVMSNKASIRTKASPPAAQRERAGADTDMPH